MANYDVELNIPGTEKCFDCLFLAPYARTTRYEEPFLPKGKKLPHYYAQIHGSGDMAQYREVRHPLCLPFVLVPLWPTRTGCPSRVGMKSTQRRV